MILVLYVDEIFLAANDVDMLHDVDKIYRLRWRNHLDLQLNKVLFIKEEEELFAARKL